MNHHPEDRKGERTRRAILQTAAALASTDGLAPLSIGDLAQATGMSKSGLFAHFGSKEELQLATVEFAREVFIEHVIRPAQSAPPGIARLWALCERWLEYSERKVFPGGCFFDATSSEFENRPGAVRDRIVEIVRQWMRQLEQNARAARDDGQLGGDADPAQLAFELYALASGANWSYQTFGDRRAFERARTAIGGRLARPVARRTRRPAAASPKRSSQKANGRARTHA